MKIIQPNILIELEHKLDSCLLDKDSLSLVKSLLFGQVCFRDLFIKAYESSGYLRAKFMREIAKLLGISVDKKNPGLSADKKQNQDESNTGKRESSATDTENSDDSDTDEDLIDAKVESDENLAAKNSNDDENSSDDFALGLGTESENADLTEQNKSDDSSKKKHPKRSNNEFNPVASYLYPHEDLEPGNQCPLCLQGRVYPFREKVIPILIGRSPLAHEAHRLQILRCNACGAILEPKLPPEVPKKGRSEASAQAVLVVMHYLIGVPFQSISNFQKMANQNVSPAQLWEITEQAADAIKPIYEELKKQVANYKIFYTDDTSARILSHYPENKKNREKKKKKGRKAPENRVGTYSSVIIGCMPDDHEIHLFYHGRKYAGENLADLLIHRDTSLGKPIQMKDASTMNIPHNVAVAESKCNAHALRKFKDLQDIYPKECFDVLRIYREVAKNEKMLGQKKASLQERLGLHKEKSLPLMEQIKSYTEGLINNKLIEPNSSLGGAIAYFQSHYDALIAFCKIEGAPFDNNKAERALKMVIRLRKTSMFYKTEHGAKIAGMLHSVLYTAQEAGVNVLEYLQTILENPERVRQKPEDFFPWAFQAIAESKEEMLLKAVEVN